MSRSSRRGVTLLGALLASLPLILLSGCAWLFPQTPMSTVHPATDAARIIMDVYRPVTWIMVGIFAVVETLLLYTVLRFRAKPGQVGNPKQVHGNTALEIGWTLIPVVLVILIAYPTLRDLWKLADVPQMKDAVRIKVVGKQWWWEFHYPNGMVTANELHVPAGREVILELTSDNVIHSFWVPRLSGKRDLVPGRTQDIWFTAPKTPREYRGQCAELCGASHALMRFRVFVDSPADYAAWLKKESGPTVIPSKLTDPGPSAMLAGGCVACHTVKFPGSPFMQHVGPPLTHVGGRTTIAAGILKNTPANMKRWIHDAPSVKPGSHMPSMKYLTNQQLDTIVAYLQSLK